MKILHVIPSVAPVRGGPSQAILQMVLALNKQGITAEIATTNDNGSEILDVPLNHLIPCEEVPTRFFSRWSSSTHALREFAFSVALTQWLWKNIRHYDLVHVHAVFSYPSTVAMAIARLKKVPYIVRPLGQLCQWSLNQSKTKKQLYLQLVEYANLNHAQVIHYTSEVEQQEAAKLGLLTQSVVIPHGLSFAPPIEDARIHLRQKLQLPDDEPIILFLSRVHPKKGIEVLIDALALLHHQRFTFVIAGNGEPEYESAIRQHINRAGIHERTHMVGFVQGEDKDLLLQGADLFALTSYSENFGVAVLEALAAGIPAIVTPGVALSKLVSEHQLGMVPELNKEAIAHALITCLKEPQEAKAMGDRARQFILEHYTWDNIAAQLIDVYAEILGVGLPGRSPYRSTKQKLNLK